MSVATYTIIVKINGQTLQGTSVSFTPGGFTRESKTAAGQAGRHFVRIPQQSMCSVTILHTADGPSLEEMRNWENVTLVAECDSSVNYQIDNAFVVNAFEISDEGGGIQLDFEGPPANEL